MNSESEPPARRRGWLLRMVLAAGKRHASLGRGVVALLSLTVLLIVVPLTLGRSRGWSGWSSARAVPAPLAGRRKTPFPECGQ